MCSPAVKKSNAQCLYDDLYFNTGALKRISMKHCSMGLPTMRYLGNNLFSDASALSGLLPCPSMLLRRTGLLLHKVCALSSDHKCTNANIPFSNTSLVWTEAKRCISSCFFLYILWLRRANHIVWTVLQVSSACSTNSWIPASTCFFSVFLSSDEWCTQQIHTHTSAGIWCRIPWLAK